MKTHELAKILLENEDVDVTCSVDIDDEDDPKGDRVFGFDLFEAMYETEGGWNAKQIELVLLFGDGYDNTK